MKKYKKKPQKELKNVFSFFLLLILLPLLVFVAQKIQTYLSKAAGYPARIYVDAAKIEDTLSFSWQALSQGGEEKKNMIASVVNEVKELSPRYIRIDHLYDYYDVVHEQNGRLVYDWSKLDAVVNSILSTGALPFLSLSYMPSAIATNGDITGTPYSWGKWAEVVQATIEHYSGKSGKNLNNVYYEVWNEPDLFGKWKVYGKDYRLLYQAASQGAVNAKNVNQFFLGGPSTTGLYPNWIKELLKYVAENNLRIDFISWHRYTFNPEVFGQDIDQLNTWLKDFPQFANLPKIISEYSLDSEFNSVHDGKMAASFTAYSARVFAEKGLELGFSFEVKDGPPKEGKAYFGGWGILTHESVGKRKKPRFFSLKLLSRLNKQRLKLSGEGTWVKGIATGTLGHYQILVFNYDTNNYHFENAPINLINIPVGTYTVKEYSLGDETPVVSEGTTSDDGVLTTTVIMYPNEVKLLEIDKKP